MLDTAYSMLVKIKIVTLLNPVSLRGVGSIGSTSRRPETRIQHHSNNVLTRFNLNAYHKTH
jgi:hypothetical protein